MKNINEQVIFGNNLIYNKIDYNKTKNEIYVDKWLIYFFEIIQVNKKDIMMKIYLELNIENNLI